MISDMIPADRLTREDGWAYLARAIAQISVLDSTGPCCTCGTLVCEGLKRWDPSGPLHALVTFTARCVPTIHCPAVCQATYCDFPTREATTQ